MTATGILEQALANGVTLLAEGGALRYQGPRKAIDDLLPTIKTHKPELLAALAGKINRWRVTHPDGQITEHSSARLTESEALELARYFGDPLRAEPVIAEPPSPPADLGALLVEACQGVPGIDPATFRSLLSPEDLEDIDGGFIPVVTLNAYARSFAEGIRRKISRYFFLGN